MLKETKNYSLFSPEWLVGGTPTTCRHRNMHLKKSTWTNRSQYYKYWVLKSWSATMLLLVKPANHACPKPNYTLESQNTWGAVQIYCISLLWLCFLLGVPMIFEHHPAPCAFTICLLTEAYCNRPTIWRQCTNADSLVIKCLSHCWLVHTSSKWWSNSLYLNPEKCFEKASAQEGLWPSPAPLLSRTMLNKWTKLMVVAKSLF